MYFVRAKNKELFFLGPIGQMELCILSKIRVLQPLPRGPDIWFVSKVPREMRMFQQLRGWVNRARTESFS